MDVGSVIAVGRDALWVATLLAGPLLLVILVVGVLICTVQAATSIQEMTLSFVPKMVLLVVTLMLIGNWQIVILIDFMERIVDLIPTLTR